MARELMHKAHRNDPSRGRDAGAKAPLHRSEAERLRDAAATLAELCPLCSGAMRAVARRGEGQTDAPPARSGLLACASCGFACET